MIHVAAQDTVELLTMHFTKSYLQRQDLERVVQQSIRRHIEQKCIIKRRGIGTASRNLVGNQRDLQVC